MPDKKSLAVVGISLFAATLILLMIIGWAPRAAAESTSTQMVLEISPLAIINNSAVQGSTFVVHVLAFDVDSLHGFALNLTYDPSLIACTNVREGGFMSSFGNTTISSVVDNSIGNAYASVNLTSSSLEANGNGTLVDFDFNVNGVGETNIVLQNVHVYNSSGSLLEFETFNGYFNNKLILDFAMPLVLFAITLVSATLYGRVEGKLKAVVEEREFRVQDAALLVGLMSVMIYLVVFVRQITLVLMALFLFAYCMLLFTFTFVFSKKRWYVAILPPALFVLLYAFVRNTSLWALYLVNIYGLIFAVLITLYLAGLFAWKTTAVFGILITAMDIVLVLVTGTMIQAAQATRSLSLPVMVSLPLVPLLVTGNGSLMLSLGLGDFFFAGLLGVQTLRKYGRRFAILTMVGMTVSFFIFEVYLLNFLHGGFPGTLMIITGWAPFVILKELAERKSNRAQA